MAKRGLALPLAVALSFSLLSCDALEALIEPPWIIEDANGDEGAFHFTMNADDLHIGYPEHVRLERIERRTIKLSGGGTREEEQTRKVRVVLARCESRSICNAEPHDADSRELIVTPRIMGKTKLYVQATVDDGKLFKDSITVTVK